MQGVCMAPCARHRLSRSSTAGQVAAAAACVLPRRGSQGSTLCRVGNGRGAASAPSQSTRLLRVRVRARVRVRGRVRGRVRVSARVSGWGSGSAPLCRSTHSRQVKGSCTATGSTRSPHDW